MPEGPEIKKESDFLNKYLKDKTINSFIFYDGRYKKKKLPVGWEKFSSLLPLKVKNVNVKGKFLWFSFYDTKITIWNTFGLTGYWSNRKTKYLKFIIEVSDKKKIYYNDKLGYGTIKVSLDKETLNKKLETLGCDILNPNEDSNNFVKKIRKKRKPIEIGKILLDQKITCGCGNYIRADALYHSKISPLRKINKLTDKELKKIWNSLQKIGFYNYSIKLGLKYKIFKKEELSELEKSSIYFEDKDSFGNKIVREKLGDRTIHYCPKIQK